MNGVHVCPKRKYRKIGILSQMNHVTKLIVTEVPGTFSKSMIIQLEFVYASFIT